MKFNLIKFKPKKNLNKIEIKGLECLNCGQPLTGNENFCSYCGQKNTTKKLSFTTFINNLFSGFFSYDSRFWTTFRPLLASPGKVSKDYISGKRARFVNPFQLYLNVSIVFFLILGISNRIDNNENNLNEIVNTNISIDSLKQEKKEQLDSILKNVKEEAEVNFSNDSTEAKIVTDIDTALNLVNFKDEPEKPYEYAIKKKPIKEISFNDKIQDFTNYYKTHTKENTKTALQNLGYPITFWNTFYYDLFIKFYKNFDQMKEDGGKSYLNKLFSTLSISLFVFLPIFTLFLMLLYIRRNYTYIEHLVFVFNTQTVFFLLLTIFFLVNFISKADNYVWIFFLLFMFYLYKAMRNFYGQSRIKTIVKYILLNFFYLILGGIGLVIVGAISFFTN